MTATTIQVRVALPLTTEEVKEAFKEPDGSRDWEWIEGCTTSQTCKACGLRIWFRDYSTAFKPRLFPCPYCHREQKHLFADLPDLNDSVSFLSIFDHQTNH